MVPVRVSPDHTTALLIVNLNPGGDVILLKSSVGQVESRMAPLRARGLNVKVSGPAGFSRDAVNVFASINGTLLLATAGLVFVLLIIIYRSPGRPAQPFRVPRPPPGRATRLPRGTWGASSSWSRR